MLVSCSVCRDPVSLTVYSAYTAARRQSVVATARRRNRRHRDTLGVPANPTFLLPDIEPRRRLQVEIVFQFFIGYFDENGGYVDDIVSVVTRYGLSINSFGFDMITSLPWSFLDFWAYQA